MRIFCVVTYFVHVFHLLSTNSAHPELILHYHRWTCCFVEITRFFTWYFLFLIVSRFLLKFCLPGQLQQFHLKRWLPLLWFGVLMWLNHYFPPIWITFMVFLLTFRKLKILWIRIFGVGNIKYAQQYFFLLLLISCIGRYCLVLNLFSTLVILMKNPFYMIASLMIPHMM